MNIKVLLGTLAGFVAGVGIGMLIAPSKGSETRERLLDSFFSNLGFGEEEFSESEMEMDATNGRAYGF